MAPLGAIETEAKALETGMQFARDVGIQEFILESDSLVLICSLLGLCTSIFSDFGGSRFIIFYKRGERERERERERIFLKEGCGVGNVIMI